MNIKIYCIEHGITCKQLATMLNVLPAQISRYITAGYTITDEGGYISIQKTVRRINTNINT